MARNRLRVAKVFDRARRRWGDELVRKSKYRRRWTLKSGKPASFPFPIDRELVWVCVGTDRSTGDSLGPFVGTMLTEAGVPNVYGTLDHPVHALNLAKMLERIEEAHPDACIVAIDACLEKAKSVGSMELRDGALEPGAGVGRVLPSVGDYNIIGIVSAEGFMEHVALQNTRLSLVIQMAKSITDFILRSLEVRMIEQVAATRGTRRAVMQGKLRKKFIERMEAILDEDFVVEEVEDLMHDLFDEIENRLGSILGDMANIRGTTEIDDIRDNLQELMDDLW